MSKATKPKSKAAQALALNKMVRNVMMDRAAWIRGLMDNRRDIEKECGHPLDISIQDYRRAFTRGDIASRVVSVLPEESWSEAPVVYETEDETETAFEKAWNDLDKRLRLCSVMLRADILSGVGRYGVILLGIDDGAPLNTIAPGLSENGEAAEGSTATPRKLLYVRPFDEYYVKVDSFENDITNPRYGMPKMYDITFADVSNSLGISGQPDTQSGVTSTKVHWSRIIHVCDNRMSSDVYGLPRMERPWNRLLDLKKIAGGSGEMFWKGGFPGISLETLPSDEPVDIDEKKTKDMVEAYQEGLQRYMALSGMTAKSLGVQVADPSAHVDIQIRLISISIGVPWRVFMGSEAAQLASEQDSRSWNRRMERRRNDYINPFIILPLAERLISMGVLPKPKEVLIDWPDLNTLSDKEKAEVAERRTNALSKYAMSGVDMLIPPFHYLTLFLGLEDDEARAILDEAMARLDAMPEPPAPAPAPNDTGGGGDQTPDNTSGNGTPPPRGRAPVRPSLPLAP